MIRTELDFEIELDRFTNLFNEVDWSLAWACYMSMLNGESALSKEII